MHALHLLLPLMVLARPAEVQPPAVDAPPAQPRRAETRLQPSSAVGPALKDVQSLPAEKRPYVRYVSAYFEDRANLEHIARIVSFVSNSLSHAHTLVPPVAVANSDGRMWRIDLEALGIDPKTFDRLAQLGSGRTPIPEPYFHIVTETVTEVEETRYWQGGNQNGKYYAAGNYIEKVKKSVKTYAQAPWLPQKEIVQLGVETQSDSPILRWDWFAYYALLEPRYHEIIGVNDLNDAKKLADADENVADKLGSETKGVVKRSEVASNTRGLRRVPTRLRRGKGYFWISDDYESSVAGNDLLANAQQLIDAKPGAHEVIWSLPNGLQAYLVTDGNGKRLDRAGIEFAHDVRNGFASVEVENPRSCMACHSTGIIPIRDEIRLVTKKGLALQVEQIKHDDARLAQQIVDRFFASDIAEEVQTDQANYAAVVKALTGQAPAAVHLVLRKALLGYEADVGLSQLARETGYDEQTVRGVLERSAKSNLDQSALSVVLGEKSRRDQLESAGFGQLMVILTALPRKEK